MAIAPGPGGVWSGHGLRGLASTPDASETKADPADYDAEEHMQAQIRAAVQANDVLLFMKGNKDAPMCGFSKAVVQVLQVHAVDFKTVNVLASEQVRAAIKRYTSWPTIPQLFVKGEFIGGCDIVMQMHQSGELAELFAKHQLLPPSGAAEGAAGGSGSGRSSEGQA